MSSCPDLGTRVAKTVSALMGTVRKEERNSRFLDAPGGNKDFHNNYTHQTHQLHLWMVFLRMDKTFQ